MPCQHNLELQIGVDAYEVCCHLVLIRDCESRVNECGTVIQPGLTKAIFVDS